MSREVPADEAWERAGRLMSDLAAMAKTMTPAEALGALNCLANGITRNARDVGYVHPVVGAQLLAAVTLLKPVLAEATGLDHSGCDAFLGTINHAQHDLAALRPEADQ